MKKVLLTLSLIAVVFFATRLYKINFIPPSVYWDEASIGYNAYSIATTLKDEWGDTLPIHLRAFGEFKLPVYIYSVIPFVKLFGLSAATVRAPAAIYSFVSLIFIYLLAAKITKNRWIGIVASFLFMVSPWLFIFTRAGYEASAGIAFYLIGVYIFLKPKNNFHFLLGIIFWILSAYSYNSFRIVVPATAITYLLIFFREIKTVFFRKIPVIAISLALVLAAIFPIYRLYTMDAGAVRLQTVSAGEPVTIAKNYLMHFSPAFLLTNGDGNLRSHPPGFGQIYFLDLVFIAWGLALIFKSRRKELYIPIILLLVSPIAAAITREAPHALRSITMPIALVLMAAIGFKPLLEKPNVYKKVMLGVTVSVYLLLFSSYFSKFVNNYTLAASKEWQDGYRQIFVNYAGEIDSAKKVIVSDEYGQPYIFSLFYLNYDPSAFIISAVRNSPDKWGASTVQSFGKFVFKKGSPADLIPGTLIFAAPGEDMGRKPYSEILNPDGSSYLNVYKL
jgi:4-amino-4-deoxy-L-arabinose transferase-like glycosyltransferase